VLARLDRRVPPLTPFFLAFIPVAVLLAFLKGLQDPDYFWHLKTGDVILSSGLPSRDPFSFTYGGPWTLHEWASETLIAWLDRIVGPTASLALFALCLPLAFALLAASARSLEVTRRGVILGVVLCGAVALPYATVRPQALSWLSLAVLMALLLRLRPERPLLLVAMPVLFGVWANVHGLYVIGLGVFGVYVLATLLHDTAMSERRGLVVATFLVSLLAAGLTPAGLEGLTYPLRYIDAGDWGLANIPEWQSPNFHDLVQVPLVLLIAVLVVVPRPHGGTRWLLAVAVLAVIGALVANRNAPVAGVLCFPYLAWALSSPAQAARGAPRGARAVELALALVIGVACAAAVPSTSGWSGVSLVRYPATGISTLRAVNPDVRLVAEYGWAGYAIDELYDEGGRVFVDGRNDMYPESILDAYTVIRNADSGWDSILAEYRADALLFPPDAPIVRGIAQADGWCEAYRDSRQVLLLACQ
jgi:hypothetical protein